MSLQIMNHYTNAEALACAERALQETAAPYASVSFDDDQELWFLTEKLRQHRSDKDQPRETQFLNDLNERVESVPFGWQGLYCDLRVSLKAISSTLRETIKIDGPFVDCGSIWFYTKTNDRVVSGLLRKAERRSRCTCMECGRPGRGRKVGDMSKTLCGSCAGLQLLEQELRQLLHNLNTTSGVMNTEKISARDISPRVRILIDQSEWINEREGQQKGSETFVNRTTLLAMAPHFSRILERVCSVNERRNG